MIALIRGRLRRKHDDRVVIEAAGVGYDVVLPPMVQRSLAGAMASDGEGAAEVALELRFLRQRHAAHHPRVVGHEALAPR